MAKYYPHKQTIVIAIVCVLIIGAALSYIYVQPTSSGNQNLFIQNDDGTINKPITSANNGDWRSQFISTTSTSSSYLTDSTKQKISQSTNLTENLSANFVSSFSQLKQANLLNNADLVNQAASNIVSNSLGSITTKIYKIENVSVIPDSTINTDSYGTSISKIIGSYSPSTTKTEFAIIQEFVSSNDSSVLSNILPILKEQKRVLAGLLLVPAPQSLAQSHLDLINGFSVLVSGSESLEAASFDSVKAIAGSSLHISGAQNVSDALSNINKIIETSGGQFDFPWQILNSLLN